MYAYYSMCLPLTFTTSSRRPSTEVVERRITSSLKSSQQAIKAFFNEEVFLVIFAGDLTFENGPYRKIHRVDMRA